MTDTLTEKRTSQQSQGLGPKPTSEHSGYDHITQVEQEFVGRKLSGLAPELTINGVLYRFSKTNEVNFEKMINGSSKGYAIYLLHPNARNVAEFKKLNTDTNDRQSAQDSIIFAWAKERESVAILPVATRFIPKSRLMNATQRGLLEGSNEIGLSPTVTVIGVNGNNPIEAKTDTGADMCSMHVDSVEVQGGSVKFSVGGSTYNTPLSSTLQVKQADSGGESRPVIKCNMSINGVTVRDVEINLNNRDGMVPLLLGKNLLQQGNFAIKVESDVIDWEEVDQLFEDIEYAESGEYIKAESIKHVMTNLRDIQDTMTELLHDDQK